MELVLIIAGVFAATGLELKLNYQTMDIGFIPKGYVTFIAVENSIWNQWNSTSMCRIPGPQFPMLYLFKELLLNSFVTAVVAYAVSMSMALILAEGENYEVDPNQEFLAHVNKNHQNLTFFECYIVIAGRWKFRRQHFLVHRVRRIAVEEHGYEGCRGENANYGACGGGDHSNNITMDSRLFRTTS
jgi:hypothetical protein